MALNSSNCSQLWACNTGSYFTTCRLLQLGHTCLGDSSTLWPGFIQSCRFLYAVTRIHPELPIPLRCSSRVADPSTLFIQSCRFLYAVHPELPIPLRCSSRVADPSTLFIQSCWSLYAVHPELLIPLHLCWNQGLTRVHPELPIPLHLHCE